MTAVTASVAASFTCLACHVAFRSADDQRGHYKTDWHRYNLKRKVADLPPVTAQNFAERLLSQQSKTIAAQRVYSGHCDACNKSYGSENAFKAHQLSKKHLQAVEKKAAREGRHDGMVEDAEEEEVALDDTTEAAAAMEVEASVGPALNAEEEARRQLLKEDSQRARDFYRRLTEATTESEIHHLLEEKKKSALRLDPEHDCLFCTHHAADIEANIAHMSSAHSFFLPDIEYMVDLHGMLTYLADKVSVMNLCLYCDGVGRGFHSLEAARRHMLDKGHTKVRYEEEEDREELAEYYDFSATWEGVEDEAVTDEEWEDADSGSSSDDDDMEVVDEAETRTIRTKARGGIAEVRDYELVLRNGTRLGHRSLLRYYKQRLRPTPLEQRDANNEAVVINRVAAHYRELGFPGASTLTIGEQRKMVQQGFADARRRDKARASLAERVGMANNNQKHYRAQIDF